MSGMFDNRIVLEVQQANDIIDVISEHVSLTKKGHEMVGLCPFHDDHKPSMNVSSVKQIFKCFACGAGGDVFKFVQMRENLSFPQAVERLAERAGIKLERRFQKPNTTANSAGKDANSQTEIDPNKLAWINNWAANQFKKNLQDKDKGKIARDYLAQRQISPESIEKWRIGYAANSNDDLIETAKAGKVPYKFLEQAGLVVAQNMDKFVNRLMFTITDVTGRVIGFGGRTLDGTGAKYVNSPTTVLFDKSNTLYGLEQARYDIVSTGTAAVVEGYTDCILPHQFGCNNVVATLGTSFTAGHGRILRRYAKKVILIYDNDTAGMEASNRALDVCLSQRIDIKIASIPQGKDPCDFLLAAGKEAFEKIMNEAVDVFQFKWDRLKEKFSSEETVAGKKTAIEEYLQSIATGFQAGHVPAIEFGLRVNQISKIIGLDSRQLTEELNRRIRQAASAARRDAGELKVPKIDYGQGRYAAAQREVLEILLNKPELYEEVREKFNTDIFDIPILVRAAVILFGALDENSGISLKEILARTESVEMGTCLMELAQAGEKKGNYEPRLAGAMEMLEQYSEQKHSKSIEVKQEQEEYLLHAYKKRGKENRHTGGMV
ncbi:MAG: DNA primase [Sedimentisphaerales bacterium]|nr:DNA primase [Sedimentisphaerales bacterium]